MFRKPSSTDLAGISTAQLLYVLGQSRCDCTPIVPTLTTKFVRKESIGQESKSRVAAHLRTSSVKTFLDTAMMSTWNCDAMRSGPENFMLVGKASRK